MKQLVSNRALTISFPVLSGDQLLTPTSDVSWSVATVGLVPVASATVLMADATPTMQIPGTAFVLEPEQQEAYLWVTLEFTDEDGRVQSVQELCRVTKLKPIIKTAADVRRLLGLTEDELEDEAVDLYSTYLDINSEVGTDILADLSKLREANDLILYTAAIKQAQTLHLKALSEHKIDDHQKKRFALDLQGLLDSLWSKRLELLKTVANIETVNEPLLSFVATTDVITGA